MQTYTIEQVWEEAKRIMPNQKYVFSLTHPMPYNLIATSFKKKGNLAETLFEISVIRDGRNQIIGISIYRYPNEQDGFKVGRFGFEEE